jgi:hypothetical protein
MSVTSDRALTTLHTLMSIFNLLVAIIKSCTEVPVVPRACGAYRLRDP